ncbi:MAG: hypothetical protein F4Z17_00810 [Acidimicrobiia bacterium]|nr:hypothetical protein [Acidimicrobiia bacterium]
MVRVESRTEDRGGDDWAIITGGRRWSRHQRDRPSPCVRTPLRGSAQALDNEAGSGLGLTIVAELAEVMGGKVSVTARQPTGARFTVQFPAMDDRLAP